MRTICTLLLAGVAAMALAVPAWADGPGRAGMKGGPVMAAPNNLAPSTHAPAGFGMGSYNPNRPGLYSGPMPGYTHHHHNHQYYYRMSPSAPWYPISGYGNPAMNANWYRMYGYDVFRR